MTFHVPINSNNNKLGHTSSLNYSLAFHQTVANHELFVKKKVLN